MAANPALFESLMRGANTPRANMLGGAALGAGLSVAGNAMSGELEDKGMGRVIAEALGAGALGGLALNRVGSNVRDMSAIKKTLELHPGVLEGLDDDTINKGLKELFNKDSLYHQTGDYHHKLSNIGGAALGLGATAALGGLGGVIGGGVSNAAEAMGIPSFGSSNTPSAKNMGGPPQMYPGQLALQPMSAEEEYLASIAPFYG